MNWIKTRIGSTKYAFNGIIECFKEPNFFIHSVGAVIVIVSGLALGINRLEWLTLLLTIGMVLIAEGLNTAIERLSDKVSSEYDELIRQAKDIAAGAVLIAALLAFIIGIVLFYPYVAKLI